MCNTCGCNVTPGNEHLVAAGGHLATTSHGTESVEVLKVAMVSWLFQGLFDCLIRGCSVACSAVLKLFRADIFCTMPCRKIRAQKSRSRGPLFLDPESWVQDRS